MKKVLIPTLLAFTTLPTFAATMWTEMGQTLATYVDMRNPPGRILIKHSKPRQDECTNNGAFYHLDLAVDGSDQAYAMILSAEAQSRDIRFYTSGCSVDGFPLIKIASTF